MDCLVALLLELMGANSFRVREWAQHEMGLLCWVTNSTKPAKRGLSHHDPEVRKRCQVVIQDHYYIVIPEGLQLIWVRDHCGKYRSLLDLADEKPVGEDVREYCRLLLKHGVHPWIVQRQLNLASKQKREWEKQPK